MFAMKSIGTDKALMVTISINRNEFRPVSRGNLQEVRKALLQIMEECAHTTWTSSD